MTGLNIDFASLDENLVENIPIGPAEQALNEQIGDGSPTGLIPLAN